MATDVQVERVERGASVALVLGSGGARGLAHIGVIQELEAAGFKIAAIAGASMGALVGGIYAAGRLGEYRDWVRALQRNDVIRLLDFTFGHPGLIKGERVIGVMRELVGEYQIEDLELPFTAVATDLGSQREVWLTRGSLFEAIRASMAIPMLFTPQRIEGRELVDGGLLSPLPIAATRRYRADLVIAVDVNDRVPASLRHFRSRPESEEAREEDPAEADPDDGNSLKQRIAAIMEDVFGKREPSPPQPGLLDLMSRSLDTIQSQISRLQLAMDPPDLLIRVPRDACYFHEFWRATELIDIGREAARRALRQAGDRANAAELD